MPEVPFLSEVLIILVAAVIVVPVFQRLRASVVIGYLVAGILVGPYGLALIEESKTTHGLAELGVIFLMFTIGLELSIERLRVIRTYIFGLGTAQVAVTGVVIGAIALLAGATLPGAVVIGAALALSSTAIVIQLLSERGEIASRVGRIAVAILLLQDLAVVPLLALVPALAGDQVVLSWSLARPILEAVAAVIAIFVLGRLVLRPILRAVAIGRSPELFAAVTLLILLGTAWATSVVGLSLAIGGFMAGLLLAETEYRHQVAADIAPFRGLLLGLFFMTVGMGLDIRVAVDTPGALVLIVVALVVVKALIVTALCRVAGNPPGTSLHVGLVLAQGGEFAFIMFAIAMGLGILDRDIGGLLVVAVALSMALSPLLAHAGRRIGDRLRVMAAQAGSLDEDAVSDLKDHVIIAGYGRVGQSVAKTLTAAEIPFVGLEYEPTRVSECRAHGHSVFFGDASRPEVMRAVGADRARAAVVTMDDPAAAERAVHLLHQHFPALHIFVRARDGEHQKMLEAAGATGIVHETFEMSLQLGGSVLRRLGTADDKIQDIILAHRAEDYARLSDVILPAVADGDHGDTDTNGDGEDGE